MFIDGLKILPRGIIRLFSSPVALAWAVAPALVFLAAVAIFASPAESWLLESFRPWLENAAGPSIPRWMIASVLWIVGVFASIAVLVISYATARLLAGPFLSLLAERILREDGLAPELPAAAQLKLMARMVLVSLNKGVIFFVLGLIFFVFALVPFLNAVAAFGVLLLLAFDTIDYSLEIYGLTLAERWSFVKRNASAFAGVAAALAFVLWIPFLNVLLFPVLVAGAAELTGRLRRRGAH